MPRSHLVLAPPTWAIAAWLAGGCASAPADRSISNASPPLATHVVLATTSAPSTSVPRLLVHVDRTSDPTRAVPAAVTDVSRAVARTLQEHHYATVWPGGPPRAAELEAHRARAFIVVPTVQAITVRRSEHRASIDCRVGIRISPWRGVDGGERWEVATAATATGAARIVTSARDAAIEVGVRDCLREVVQQVATNRIVPFLDELAK